MKSGGGVSYRSPCLHVQHPISTIISFISLSATRGKRVSTAPSLFCLRSECKIMASKTTLRHDLDHKSHHSSHIPSQSDGAPKLPPRSLTFDSTGKLESIETYQKQNLQPPLNAMRKGSTTPIEHSQPSEPRRPSAIVVDDDNGLSSNLVRENMSTSWCPC